MNYKIMGRFVGKILMVEAVFMVPALFIALARGEGDAVRGFFLSILAIVLLAGILLLLARKPIKAFMPERGLRAWDSAGLS